MSDYICYFAQSIPEIAPNLVQNEDKIDKNNENQKEQKSELELNQKLANSTDKSEKIDNISSNFNPKYKSKIKSKLDSAQVFGLSVQDRRRHIYAVGKTGMGKSTMLQNIVLQDIFAGLGVCLIDPHGDSVEYILDRIPKHRHQDVIYLNPADTNFPIGLNVLENENGEPDFLIAAGLMSVFKRIWVGAWSSRMEYILNNTLLALLEVNSQIKNLENLENLNNLDNLQNLEQNKKDLENPKTNLGQNVKNIDKLIQHKSNYDFKISKTVLAKDLDQNIHKIQQNLKQNFDKINNSNQNQKTNFLPKDKHKDEILKLLGTQTLLGVVKMLSDSDFCSLVVECVQNPLVRNFWTHEFASFNDKYRQEAVAPILNKIGQFFSTSLTLNILGQTKSSLNFRRVMDNSQILLVNLSKGRLGDDNSNLLGSLIVNKIQLAAMTRVDLAEEKRKDWSLVVDEFQNFTTESFVTILSEARKYRLNLVLAHQYLSQLEESGNARTKNAIFGNVGSIISFQIGAIDARELILEFGEPFRASDLVNLCQNQIIVKMPKSKKNFNPTFNSTFNSDSNNYNFATNKDSTANYFNSQESIQTLQSNCFKAATLPSIFDKFGGQKDELIQLSRSKYGKKSQEVEYQINQFLATNFQTFQNQNSQNSSKYISRNNSENKNQKDPKNVKNLSNSSHNPSNNSNKKSPKVSKI